MTTQAPNQNPEGLSAVWRSVHQLEKDLEKLRKSIPKPSALSNASSWVWQERNWSIAVILLVLASLGSGTYFVGGLLPDQHIRSAVDPVHTDITKIDGEIQRIEGQLSGIQLTDLSKTPGDPQSIQQVQTVLNSARSGGLRIANDAIAASGAKFLEAANASPDAWNAVTEFLRYRSYLNSVTISLGPQVELKEPIGTLYSIPKSNIPQAFSMMTIGSSKSPNVPQLRALSEPDLNYKLPVGPSFLVVNAPTIVLDGLYAKKIVFENSHIIYRGGPTSLENVYFFNCTFEIEREPKGQGLAKTILSEPTTSFVSG